jgi:hypothetical protein
LCGSPGWFVGDILSCGLTYCPNKMVILVPVDCYEDFEINGVSCVGIKAPLVSLILWGHTSSANPRICWFLSNRPRLPWTDEVHSRFMAAHLCYSWGWLDTLWETQKVTTAFIFLLSSKLLLWSFLYNLIDV